MVEVTPSARMSVRNLSGRWILDKTRSTNMEETMQVQGVSYLTRKALCALKITLDVEHNATKFNITSTISGTRIQAHENRRLDWSEVENDISIFGLVRGRSRIAALGDGDDIITAYDFRSDESSPEQSEDIAWLSTGWLCEDESATKGTIPVVETQGDCSDGGWASHQTWGFQIVDGQYKHVRRVLTWRWRDGKKVRAVLVYDRLEE